MEQNVPGKNFLKVASIIGIVFASIALLLNMGGAMIVENFSDTVALGVTAPVGLSWGMYYTISFLMLGFSLFAYIMGVANCTNLAKAKLLQILGAIMIVFILIISFITRDAFGALAIVMFAVELVLPILYIIGASKNKKELT